MNVKHIRLCLVACSLVVAFEPLLGLAQQNSDASKTSVQQTPSARDGMQEAPQLSFPSTDLEVKIALPLNWIDDLGRIRGHNGCQ